KIYSLAKVFADKLDNSNTIIKSNTSLEVIKWNANAKDKLGTKTLLVSETRFGGGGWTTETATDDEFDEFYGEPKSETLVNAESKELSKTCYELVEETTTKKGKVITEATSAIGSVFSTFFGRHDTKSIETTQNIISKQTNEGSFHISDTLSEILEISSDTKSQSFKSTIQTYAVSKCLKKTTTHHTWWSTAITISYLKLHAFSHETTWKIQYEKARKYLSEQIKDAELEEELLKTCCNLVEEKTTKKVVYTETKEEIKDYHHTTTNVGSVKHHHDKKVEEKKQKDTKHKKEETEQETIIEKISHVFGSSKEEEKAKNEELKEKEQNTSKISHAFASEDEETIEKKEKDDHHTTKFIAGDVTTVKHSYDKKREKKHEEEHSATEGVVSGVTSTIGSVFSDVAKIYNHGKTFLTFNEEKENLSKQILQIKDEYNDLIKEKDKTIAEFKESIAIVKLNNISLTNNNNDLNSKMSEKDAANDKLRKETIEYQNLYSTLVAKYNDLVQEYNNLKEELIPQIAMNVGLTETNIKYEKQYNQYVSQLNRLKKHNSELQLQHDHLSELQDKIQSYITNLRTTIAELDYNNIDNLLIKYNYVTGAKEIQRNKPLVKALLQRAVFDKLIELLKDFG
ncbi:11397_t:CDS:2, partial [Entrophospora sp. SA101]